MKKSNRNSSNDYLSIVMMFFDEAVATSARRRIFASIFCGIGATMFSVGIAIGTTKTTDEKNQGSVLEEKQEET